MAKNFAYLDSDGKPHEFFVSSLRGEFSVAVVRLLDRIAQALEQRNRDERRIHDLYD
jgi:hypothetical protein